MGWLWLFAVLNSVESVVFLALFWWFLFFLGVGDLGICISLLFGWYDLWG
jgi:hypothetical protein